uniref:NADH-ubiquinone oxidoreductase chain 6 n=1 Tax=Coprinus comatus TaxID=56187 RepID=A0A8A6NN95_COPCM|nr:NADH dehydrogenase subunit 6 [Coprinus comatus]QTJ26213.1 NADH dehydrogenase subunit 6 [Coprinus comatus]
MWLAINLLNFLRLPPACLCWHLNLRFKARLILFKLKMTTIFVNMLAFATLISSILSITSKNPVISVIFLISTFVSGAGYLILIGINFVGISYIIVYVGAIAVLFLFVIMMINIKLTDILETGSQYTKNLPLAIAIGSLFIFLIFSIIPFNFNNVPAISIFLDKITYLNTIFYGSGNAELGNYCYNLGWLGNNIVSAGINSTSDVIITDFQQIEALGYSLYTYGAVLLITLSMILLLAMFATIVISKIK